MSLRNCISNISQTALELLLSSSAAKRSSFRSRGFLRIDLEIISGFASFASSPSFCIRRRALSFRNVVAETRVLTLRIHLTSVGPTWRLATARGASRQFPRVSVAAPEVRSRLHRGCEVSGANPRNPRPRDDVVGPVDDPRYKTRARIIRRRHREMIGILDNGIFATYLTT